MNLSSTISSLTLTLLVSNGAAFIFPVLHVHHGVIRTTIPLQASSSSSSSSSSVPINTKSNSINNINDVIEGTVHRRGALAKALQTAAFIVGTGTTTLTTHPQISTAAETTTLPPKIPTAQLGKGTLSVSRTIQGYWQLAGGHGKYNPADAIQNMQSHYAAGITTLDTADIYGPSEQIVGKFMKDTPAAIPCTKFCCFRYLEEIDKAEVRSRILKSCERLQVSSLPLVQFFWSDYSVKRYVEVALLLTELKEEGLIQEIGATNFDLPKLKELTAAGVPLVSHQVQLSALDRRPVQSGMADWCTEQNISLLAFGTVGSGILSETYLGRDAPEQADKKTASMRLYGKSAERFGDWSQVQDLLKVMDAVARGVREEGRCAGASIANVAQRFVLEEGGKGVVASVLVGVRNRAHLEDNVRTHGFELTEGERDAIEKVVGKRKDKKGDVWDTERAAVYMGTKKV